MKGSLFCIKPELNGRGAGGAGAGGAGASTTPPRVFDHFIFSFPVMPL